MRNVVCTVLVAVACICAAELPASAQSNDTGEFEVFGGATFKLVGSRAFVTNGRQTADSGEHNVLPVTGIAFSDWIGKSKVFGLVMDFSFVDAGKANASLGSNTAEVRGSMFDFHTGFQVQAPGRVRPYAYAGGGLVHSSITGTFKLFGVTSSEDQSETHQSLLYGAGVRMMATDDVGIRFGVDGVRVSRSERNSGLEDVSYGRLVVGVFRSF